MKFDKLCKDLIKKGLEPTYVDNKIFINKRYKEFTYEFSILNVTEEILYLEIHIIKNNNFIKNYCIRLHSLSIFNCILEIEQCIHKIYELKYKLFKLSEFMFVSLVDITSAEIVNRHCGNFLNIDFVYSKSLDKKYVHLKDFNSYIDLTSDSNNCLVRSLLCDIDDYISKYNKFMNYFDSKYQGYKSYEVKQIIS